MEVALFDCYQRCRARDPTDLKHVLNRAKALEIIQRKAPTETIATYCEELVGDFVKALERLLYSESKLESGGLLQRPFHTFEDIGVAVRMLLRLGTKDDFQRIEAWASKATLQHLSSLRKVFHAESPAVVSSNSRDSSSRDHCAKTVESRYKALKIDDLKKQREELIGSTQCGQQNFDWCMPMAATESTTLNGFLHSSRKGPETIVVGGGEDFSQSLCAKYRFLIDNSEETLRLGFSAIIQHNRATGDQAAVTVTKTKDLHLAQVEQYQRRMAMLRNVCVELRRLGAHVELMGAKPLADAQREREKEAASENTN